MVVEEEVVLVGLNGGRDWRAPFLRQNPYDLGRDVVYLTPVREGSRVCHGD